MNRRTRRTLWMVAAVLLVLAVAVFLRSKAPPEAARLLAESDGILLIQFDPIRCPGAIVSRLHTHAASNDAKIDAWRFYENYDHAGR